MDTSKIMTWKMVGLIFFSTMLTSFPAFSFAEECPQTRKTPTAPKEFLNMQNPLPLNDKNLKSAEKLFQVKAKPIACKFCHGVTGNGEGDPDFESTPSARDFTCAATMKKLPDGQLFWVIRNGSKNTAMFAFSDLSDHQIWQLVHYIRSFGK
jgi:cytochrome c553